MKRAAFGAPRDSREESEQLELALAASLAEARSLLPDDDDFTLVDAPSSSSAERDTAPITVAIGQLVINTYSGAAEQAGATTACSTAPRPILRSRAIELDENLASGNDVRFYAVWGVVPLVAPGVHVGTGAKAYHGLLSQVGGSIGKLKFKRAPSLAAAEALYRERAKKPADEVINHYYW